MIHRIVFLGLLGLAGAVFANDDKSAGNAGATQAASKTPIDIGSRRELFVEEGIIDRLSGKAELRLHHPVPQAVVLEHAEPWEGSGSGYHSIFQDGDRYRMYYAAGQLDVTASGVNAGTHGLFCCYAESDDGIHWKKPVLGLHEFQGSKANNIVMVRQQVGDYTSDPGEPAIFKDENPDAPPRGALQGAAARQQNPGRLSPRAARVSVAGRRALVAHARKAGHYRGCV